NTPGITSVGLTGVGGNFCKPENIGIGVYAGINTNEDNGEEFKPESCALLVDNRSTGKPLMIARTENGKRLFEITAKGQIATNAPDGSANAQLRFGVSGQKLIIEINGQTFGVKLEKLDRKSVV